MREDLGIGYGGNCGAVILSFIRKQPEQTMGSSKWSLSDNFKTTAEISSSLAVITTPHSKAEG